MKMIRHVLTYDDSDFTMLVIISTSHHGPHCVTDQCQNIYINPLLSHTTLILKLVSFPFIFTSSRKINMNMIKVSFLKSFCHTPTLLMACLSNCTTLVPLTPLAL